MSILPSIHHQHYQKLKQAFEQLKQHVASTSPVQPNFLENFLQVQQFFQQQVVNLNPELLNPDVESRLRSYQTEINKQLRLLNTDLTFLRAAKQAITFEQRQTQICDRLDILINYCEVLLQDN